MDKKMLIVVIAAAAVAAIAIAVVLMSPGAAGPASNGDGGDGPDNGRLAETCAGMPITEAIQIAQSSACAAEGALKTTRMCNEGTKTWWLDLDISRPGCAPACVVNAETRQAEINWRCTGLIPNGEEAPCVVDPHRMCTMEYAPVCGVDGITYGNACGAKAMCVEVAYQGECRPEDASVPEGELMSHNTADNCWVAYAGKIYDITEWLPQHPSMGAAIIPYCGKSAEFANQFESVHGTGKVSTLEGLVLKGNAV